MSILDPIQSHLPSNVWDQADSPEPVLKPKLHHFIVTKIYQILEQAGYGDPHKWLTLYFTGSLCTYQYSETSDADISLFVDSAKFPEWSRAEMIGLMISKAEHLRLPGTAHPLQAYVVAAHIKPSDTFKPGLRSAYSVDQDRWIVPPDHAHAHDPQVQENGFYVWALEQADKMERLLRYEPDKAIQFWHQIHQRRMRDQRAGKGDFSESNILYKFLFQRGLAPQIAQLSGEHIAAIAEPPQYIRAEDISSPSAIERGLSREVSPEEFEQLASEGERRYNDLRNYTLPTGGLDQNWPSLIDLAYQRTREPWGGATIDAHTGQPFDQAADAYALTVREPGMPTISIPPDANPEQFAGAMNKARDVYDPILERAQHSLGVFHDADRKRIDFDPVLIVDNPHDVESIGAYTNATGGAYHFKSGEGLWPPHTKHGKLKRMAGFADAIAALANLKQQGLMRDFVLIGSVASSIYTAPRATEDLDVVVLVDSDQEYLELLQRVGQGQFEGMHVMIGGIPVQMFPVTMGPLYQAALQDARVQNIGGQEVKVASPEILTLLARQAGRPQDQAREADLQTAVDSERLKTLEQQFNVGPSQLAPEDNDHTSGLGWQIYESKRQLHLKQAAQSIDEKLAVLDRLGRL